MEKENKFIVHIEGLGYYGNQSVQGHNYHWQFTDELKNANQYATLANAQERADWATKLKDFKDKTIRIHTIEVKYELVASLTFSKEDSIVTKRLTIKQEKEEAKRQKVIAKYNKERGLV